MTTLQDVEGDKPDAAAHDYWAQTRTLVIEDWVAEAGPDSLIDLGCGTGYLAERLAKVVPLVVGIDNDEEAIERARNRNGRVEFFREDILDLDVTDDAFQCAIIADVLEHIEQTDRVVGLLDDLLVDGGTVIVTVPNHEWLYGPHDANQDHVQRYSKSALNRVFEPEFELVRSRCTNALILPPYAIMQKIVKREVPAGARGSSHPAVEYLKGGLISVETGVPWPVGVTLLAEFRRA